MFRRFSQKLYYFMLGRNGQDSLCKTCIWSGAILLLISSFVWNRWVMLALALASYGLIIYGTWRMLSKNVAKRRLENARFLQRKEKVKSFFRRKKAQFKDRKTHVYKKCPSCRATLRLPKQKGKHGVCCPKCKNNFEVKI